MSAGVSAESLAPLSASVAVSSGVSPNFTFVLAKRLM
jgi:hypothetical protein